MDIKDVQLSANISWTPRSSSANLTVTSASVNTESRTLRVDQAHYVFTAPPNAPPCEVYNFSVTATPVGATYTGDGCSVPSPTFSTMLPSLPDVSKLESSLNYSMNKVVKNEDSATVLIATFMVIKIYSHMHSYWIV